MGKCSCGKQFDPDEAAEKFNSHFNGQGDYYFQGYENCCADCAIFNEERIIESGDDRNYGCTGCGNLHSDAFPHCKLSCKLYDN